MSQDNKKDVKEKQSSGKKGGRGTHGSLTKSGKVRSQTPKIEKSSTKKHQGPLQRNRIEYINYLKKSKENAEKKYQRDF